MNASLPQPTVAKSNRAAVWLALLAVLASMLVHLYAVVFPVLVGDDFEILLQSWTWNKTWDGLWVPQNEHSMPLGRLFTFGMNVLAGRPSALPFLAALVGPLGLLLGLPYVYRFVSRELGHPFYGTAAVVLFGVTSVYQQAVFWFAASFSVFALDMLLLALLAAQNYRRTGSRLQLGLCVLWCALSPGWFAYGVLAGPLCCLYLWPWEQTSTKVSIATRLRFWCVRSAPLLGTLVFLSLSLPHNAEKIMHLEHYKSQKTNAYEAFQPSVGVVLAGRAVIENLLFGVVGVNGMSSPAWWELAMHDRETQIHEVVLDGHWLPGSLVILLLVPTAAWAVWWWLRSPARRLLLLGLGLIFASYLLAYSARAKWAETVVMNTPNWSRYHLWPQLGLTLFLCGGLPAWNGRWFRLRPDGGLTRWQGVALCCLIALFLLIQVPRGIVGSNSYFSDPHQAETFQRIEEVDRCCRAHGIGADAARGCLPAFTIPWSPDNVNGWEFLVGSDRPLDLKDEEVTRILANCR